MLEQCVNLLDQLDRPDLGNHLQTALADEPLETPPDHKGHVATQVFRVALDLDLRAEMLASIERAHALGITTPQTEQRGLGGFVEAWREYAAYEAER